MTVHVLVDASASMDFGAPNKLDFARRAGAALAYLGLANLDRVSVAFLGDGRATMLRPLRGKARVFEVFGFLSGSATGAAHRARGGRARLCGAVCAGAGRSSWSATSWIPATSTRCATSPARAASSRCSTCWRRRSSIRTSRRTRGSSTARRARQST